MLKRETIKTATTIVVGFALAFLVVGTSPSFQSCMHEQQQQESTEAFQKGISEFLILLKSGGGCTGEFIHKNADSIIALFTVILGIATWLLWRSTRDLVIGAESTARRQLRAYIVAMAGEVQRIDGGFLLSAVLKNTGQTPAFNARIMGSSFGEKYPLVAEYPHTMPGEDFGITLGAGEEFHCAYRIFAQDPDDTWKRILAGEVGLWIQGVVIYDDCFKNPHTTKFRFVYGGRIANATIHMHADRHGNQAD